MIVGRGKIEGIRKERRGIFFSILFHDFVYRESLLRMKNDEGK